jgi:hypothetical protein
VSLVTILSLCGVLLVVAECKQFDGAIPNQALNMNYTRTSSSMSLVIAFPMPG